MRLSWMDGARPKRLTETLSRWGSALTERLSSESLPSARQGPARPEAFWTDPPGGAVVVTRAPLSDLAAVTPEELVDRMRSGAAQPERIVVDLTGAGSDAARVLAPVSGCLARAAFVALVGAPEGAAEAARLGAMVTVRSDGDLAASMRLAIALCTALVGPAPTYDALQQTHRQLQEVHARLLARSVDVGARQAMIVHDLRSPLTVVQGVVAELLEAAPLSAEDRKLVELMDDAAAQLEALVDRLEQLYAPSSEVHRKDRVDLAALARGVAEGLRHSPDARAKVIEVRAADSCSLYADRQDLVRVLTNLLGNALRHANAVVLVEVVGDANEVRLVVADDGPGIAPSVRAHLFERGVRNPGAGRMGLGLAIVQRAVERHHGSVEVHERNARPDLPGACFVIRLPKEAP